MARVPQSYTKLAKGIYFGPNGELRIDVTEVMGKKLDKAPTSAEVIVESPASPDPTNLVCGCK